MSARTAVVLFTRDLRVHDHPALATACTAFDRVVPLYVLDPALADRSPNRTRFLHQSLAELREELRRRGGDLVVRQGDPVAETIRLAREVGAEGIGLSADVSRYARRRERRLRAECDRRRRASRLRPPSAARASGSAGSRRQAERYDPDGGYVRRWVPELASVARKAVHQPWRLPDDVRRKLDYPPPLELPGADPVWMR